MDMARFRRILTALIVLGWAAGEVSGGMIAPAIIKLRATASDVKLRTGGTAPLGVSQGYLDMDPANIFSAFTELDKFNGRPTLGEENFAVAFSNWNSAHGDSWKLISGGDLDITFIVIETAFISKEKTGGGVEMHIVTADYKPAVNGPTLSQLGWTQAVIANFQPGVDGRISPPIVTLDTFSTQNRPGQPTPIPAGPDAKNNTKPSDLPANSDPGYADPLYPFLIKNLTDNPPMVAFADQPNGTFPDASFRAIALLSTVTLKTDAAGKVIERDLTVYQGVNWGFDVSVVVPEQSSLTLLILGGGLLGLWILRRRKSGGKLGEIGGNRGGNRDIQDWKIGIGKSGHSGLFARKIGRWAIPDPQVRNRHRPGRPADCFPGGRWSRAASVASVASVAWVASVARARIVLQGVWGRCHAMNPSASNRATVELPASRSLRALAHRLRLGCRAFGGRRGQTILGR